MADRVLGIGGVFLRGAPELLAWYAEHLEIEVEEWGGTVFRAREGDETVWSVFPRDTT